MLGIKKITGMGCLFWVGEGKDMVCEGKEREKDVIDM